MDRGAGLAKLRKEVIIPQQINVVGLSQWQFCKCLANEESSRRADWLKNLKKKRKKIYISFLILAIQGSPSSTQTPSLSNTKLHQGDKQTDGHRAV